MFQARYIIYHPILQDTMNKLVVLRHTLRQYASLFISTPLLLGPACLPIVPVPYARTLFDQWVKVMLNSIDLSVNINDSNSPIMEDINNGTKQTEKSEKRGTLYIHLNQQTHLASLLYSIGIPKQFSIVTNIEYSLIPLIGWLQVRFGSVTIIRQNPVQAKSALQVAVDRLKRGESVAISIEGQRTLNGELCPYKKGPAVMAIEAQCDIVPFLTHGEYLLWPRGSWSVFPGGKVDMTLLPSMSTVGMTYADRDQLTSKLRVLAAREVEKWEIDNKEYIHSVRTERGGK